MRAKTSTPQAGSLREAKRQFDRWRRGCRRPGRVPHELWRLAAEVATEHGMQKTAEHLQVNAQRLEQWVEQLGLVQRPAEPAAAEFVELPPLPMGSPAECHVEVEDPSGRKLRLSLKGQAVAQLASVLPAVWKEVPR